MKQKEKVKQKRLRAGHMPARTPYENLIHSLRHAYDKTSGIEINSEKEENNNTKLPHLVIQ